MPFYPVPLVLDLIDVVDGLASISTKAVNENEIIYLISSYGKTSNVHHQALHLLESKLSDIVNRSVVLAKYLMSEDFVSKEKLVKDLGKSQLTIKAYLLLKSLKSFQISFRVYFVQILEGPSN